MQKTVKHILGVAVALAMTASGAFAARKKVILLLITLSFAAAYTASASFYQGFETNTNGWVGANRATLSDGVPSHSGGFHAEAPTGTGTYTLWGGESRPFPLAGFKTDIWVYLNMTPAGAANDTRFDWTTAIGMPDCGFRRDFVFNFGFYNDSVAPGSGPRFVVSGSNNAGRPNSDPRNSGRNPFAITTTGWYKLEEVFENDGGTLKVTLSVYDSTNTLLHNASQNASWVLEDATDIIGTTVGGNRYGWFATQEFSPFLAFDDTSLTGIQIHCEDGTGPAASAGYWINHPNAWSEPSITIGGHLYSEKDAIALMQKPTAGDMSYQMFSQLVAAELNIDCLNSNASCVADALNAADSFMTTYPPGSGVKASSNAWKVIAPAYNTLCNYNQGILCAPPIN
jgi:hypothetical protein